MAILYGKYSACKLVYIGWSEWSWACLLVLASQTLWQLYNTRKRYTYLPLWILTNACRKTFTHIEHSYIHHYSCYQSNDSTWTWCWVHCTTHHAQMGPLHRPSLNISTGKYSCIISKQVQVQTTCISVIAGSTMLWPVASACAKDAATFPLIQGIAVRLSLSLSDWYIYVHSCAHSGI